MTYNIIKTENYLLVVDDSEIKKGDWCLANGVTYNNTVVKYLKIPCPPPYVSNLSILKKIIAHLPINNSFTLKGVDLLPPLERDDVKLAEKEFPNLYQPMKGLDTTLLLREGFQSGYNKAKEKYKWTDEDVIKIVEKSRETGLTAEYLLLSLSQPKSPITFMFETEYTCCGRYENCKGCDATAEMINLRPKTTTNSQGQTILLGKYIY